MTWILDGSDYGDGEPGDPPLAECQDVVGAFADLPTRPGPEHFTLVGCEPRGRLLAAVTGTGERWLANVSVDPSESSDLLMQELTDVTVVGHRPSALVPGRLDIDLTGMIRHEPEQEIYAVEDKPEAVEFTLDEGELGRCADVVGVYREMPETPETILTLLGCRPGPQLVPGTELLGALYSVAYDGGRGATLMRAFRGSVVEVRPSGHGDGLVDVEFDSGYIDPSPAAAKEIWELWQRSAPPERNLWARYDAPMRMQWAGAAMCHDRPKADRPAGRTYELDGRYVTDVPGFYCALGEAINGPGGYFGWNGNAVDDCLRGGFGAQTPFTLIWRDVEVARRHLHTTFDLLVDQLAEKGVTVLLR